ncbi:phosphodiesterase [Mediterraneibacter glycyrrhizinilyticus]|uniref:phosphodiesterase n=1 Tax=Mediterraneibacter glycyrrhizinilyticus TaxID=342942 RepID=UPI0025AAB6B2|nr:phosphodiesterase [Mediterraneibacter glycyrrhizinilyticus]MDN0062455.1 phosphodiesterase [Mediterraneibacter glycyrrhizinilyticus]
MKLMIASDIHGSARYCGQMLEAYRREEADRLLILGDILYHGPRNDLPEGYAPKEVIAMLNPMREHLLCVRGNCDTEVDQMVLKFPIMADYCFLELPGESSAVAGNTEQRGADSGQADGSVGTVSIFATHGHVYHPKHLPPLKDGDILLTGHTHVPACDEIMDMDGNRFWYLNPGSVSIPKEGSVHGYMIYENGKFEWKNMQGEDYMTWKTDSRS